MKALNALLIAGLYISACETPQQSNSEYNPIESVPSRDIPSETEETAHLDYERRFCQDDVYSRFIQTEYIDANNQTIEQDSKAFRRLRSEAQQAAFHKLNTQLPIMFDGMPVEASPRVYAWIRHFTGRGRIEFLQWLVRSESVRPLLLPLLKNEGLAPEFLYLAMIESGFSNTAFSRAAATGTWQFMKPTAKHYGLKINYWVDERRDPIKSTLAAARYLKDLHRQLSDWYLAIAAYNAGPGKIKRAIQAAHSRDYWTLSKTHYLKAETKNYVPKLLAALIIASHPQNYGFSVTQDLRNTTPMTTIALNRPYQLSEIAEHLAIPAHMLKRWNPEIIRGITPPKHGTSHAGYSLRMPKIFAAQFAKIEDGLSQLSVQDMQMHRIQKGETLGYIAKRYRISVQELLHFNPELEAQKLKPGRS
ncbi:MAG: transglycosylase SLT domain-containing protein [Proteobacteria bacterium]|nr:transglycosylase SLT domain-containing protein [Pseudomonadota bacterium]